MTRLGLGMIACALCATVALAGPTLSGEDAAYIDWSVNNCATKSTDKEHAMVDQANAKDAAGFLRKYQSTNLGDALSTPSKQASMCAEIKGWYGPGGSRFPDLIKWEGTAAATPASNKPAPATTERKGRRRSSQ